MSHQYWEDLYQRGETHWDKGEASPGLEDFLAAFSSKRGSSKGSVLVPGCGTGHDVRAWARHGFGATGFDIAPSAIDTAARRATAEGLQARFLRGDFLRDAPFQPFDWIFEHTLFCAIQPAERSHYVEAVSRWLAPHGRFLAIFYLIPDKDGPPFGSTREEIRERFDPHFELLEDWVPRSYPVRTNLEWMTLWKQRNPKEPGGTVASS